MKKWLLVFSIIVFSVGCDRPKGFTLKKITSHHASAPEWEVENTMSRMELASLMGSQCHYLGSGNHTYAFVSDDDEAVIKFFKQKHMRIKTGTDSLSIFVKKIFHSVRKIDQRTKERQDSFSSYKLAFEKLPEETGMLCLHLNKTDTLNLSLTLIDQNGKTFEVSLDEMEFLIQKKATLVFHHLKALYKKGQSKEAERAILSLFEVVAKRSQKGIYDKDLQFFKNFGFVNNRAIEIDIGEFRTNQAPRPTYEELKTLSYQIHDFLKMHAPKHLSKVESKIVDQIEQYK